MTRPHLVVKFGGSLHASPRRDPWLSALARWPHRLTLVCGGGPFADAVRAAQPVMGLSEVAAHGMALLAMEQYALALADLHPALALADDPAQIGAAHVAGRIALWRPYAMVSRADDVEARWQVTSDSLAAWLARRLAADALLVVKSVDAVSGAELVSRDIVDPAFPAYSAGLGVYVAGPAALDGAPAQLAKGALPGARIDFPALVETRT